MIPADADELVTSQDIAEKYEANEGNVAYWTTLPGFPEGWPSGPGRTLVRDAALVDEWLKENLPVHWAKGQDSDNPFGLPAGRPKDLVTLSDICAWEGKALGRTEPVPEATLRGYISRKVLPGPDRTPGDGKRPEVTERKWFRETAYTFVNRKRRMRRQTTAEESAVSEQAPAVGSELPGRSTIARTEHLDAQGIATAYSVSGQTARGWIRAEGFPEAGENGYSAAAVDEWVHENRRRTWAAAQRRAQLPGHAWADSSASDEDAGAQKDLADRAPAAEPAAQAHGEQAELTAEMIGPRYGVSEYTGLQWTKVKEKREGDKVVRRAFPAPRSTQPRTYDQHEVDAWVEKHRPHVWAAFKGTEPALVHDLPEGDPRDLLDIYDFAEVLGMTTRGEALARETVRAYHARGQVPFADRTADDGKKPRVFQDHWYRETVYGFVLSRRGSGRFGRRS
ncbi:hypothetical protein AB9Q10_19715 [Streptomyces krungchingensis]|uniref:hypothetical protein n=1 Tax=Streptomyces krungchingensis TaxID=1565034 RepID=UPI003CF6844B